MIFKLPAHVGGTGEGFRFDRQQTVADLPKELSRASHRTD